LARFRDLPIRRKLMTGFMLTSLVALMITMGGLALYDRAAVRNEVQADGQVVTGIIAENAASSIVFNDPETATQTLAALRAQPDVIAAYLFDIDGKLFASYATPSAGAAPKSVPSDDTRFEHGMLTVTRAVIFNKARVGTVHLRSGLAALEERRNQYLKIAAIVLTIATIVALAFSAAFQRAISRPILELLHVEKRVSREKNYDLRAEKKANDEIGNLIDGFNEMLGEIRARDEEIFERHRQEMALARSIQTSVLPRTFDLAGFDISAIMMPAEEVGGDFYEFRPAGDGAWIGVGDVTGHGVTSGLIMMMCQSMFTMLLENSNGHTGPARFLTLLNRAMFYNLRSRLDQERFMTMVVAKIERDGNVTYAGAHTDLLVYRAASGMVDRLPTDGLWLGLSADISGETHEQSFVMQRGDVALFHTDGVTEARNREGECFDMERLTAQLVELHAKPASEIVTTIAQTAWNWAGQPNDDVSLLAVKRG